MKEKKSHRLQSKRPSTGEQAGGKFNSLENQKSLSDGKQEFFFSFEISVLCRYVYDTKLPSQLVKLQK